MNKHKLATSNITFKRYLKYDRALWGATPQLRSGILGFRSEVSGGESRCVRKACVSPTVQSFSFVLGVPVVLVLLGVCSRVSGSACDTGWVFSAAFLSLYGRDWVRWCGPRVSLTSPNKDEGLAVAVVGSPSSWVLGFGLAVELFGVLGGASPEEVFRPVPLFYMNLGFNGCIRSQVGELEAAIFSTLLRTTASSAARSSSCCWIVVLDRARPRAAASEGLTILAAAAAFTQQLLLFHFHSADHMGVEGQYHFILQLIIFVSLMTTLMGIALPKSFLVSLVRSSSIAFQGVWLIFLGCMLYIPSLIPKGCFIHDENSHQGVKCSTEEALHKAKSLVYIEFSWLFVINTIFVVTLYMILDRVYGENVEYSSLTSNYQREQYDEEQQHFESESTQKMSFVQMGKFDDHGDKM
ncbi:unnamed protein product [Brassica oleracea var. botrytis]